jgi:hypothetical protein
MILQRIFIAIIFCILSSYSYSQTSISDYLDVSTLRNQKIKGINLFSIDGSEKVLIERNEFNNKGFITREIVYCNSLNDPTDEIEITYSKYDKSDTLIIGQSYGIKKGDKIDFVYSNSFSYVFDNNHQILKRRTVDSVDNDIEEDTYLYNELGQISKKKTDFYNVSGDSIRFFFINNYEYNNSGQLIKDVFISDINTYERQFSYDNLGNRLTYKYKGRHIDGNDIDNIKIIYDNLSKPIFKEVCFASGEKVFYKYSYDKSGTLLSVLVSRKFLKNDYLEKNSENNDSIPPPPPPPSESNYKRNYSKDYKNCFYYDSKGHIIKVTVKHFRYKLLETYLLEYE